MYMYMYMYMCIYAYIYIYTHTLVLYRMIHGLREAAGGRAGLLYHRCESIYDY